MKTSPLLFFFVLLTLLTLCSNLLLDKYVPTKEQLLSNHVFATNEEYWEKQIPDNAALTVTQNTLNLYSENMHETAAIFQERSCSGKTQKLLLSAELATDSVSPGEKGWNKARLLLVQYIEGKANYQLQHNVASLSGTHPWQHYSKIFTLSPVCSSYRVVLQLNHSPGKFSIRNLSLHEAHETTIYIWCKWLITGLWFIFISLLFLPEIQAQKKLYYEILAVVTVAAIFIGTAIPGKTKNEIKDDIIHETKIISGPIRHSILELTDLPSLSMGLPDVDITKIAHFSLFAFLTLLLLLKGQTPRLHLFCKLSLLACASEMIQFYADGRTPLFTDVMIDMAGVGIVFLVFEYRRWKADSFGKKE